MGIAGPRSGPGERMWVEAPERDLNRVEGVQSVEVRRARLAVPPATEPVVKVRCPSPWGDLRKGWVRMNVRRSLAWLTCLGLAGDRCCIW